MARPRVIDVPLRGRDSLVRVTSIFGFAPGKRQQGPGDENGQLGHFFVEMGKQQSAGTLAGEMWYNW